MQEVYYSWLLGDRINIAYAYPGYYYLENQSCQCCVPVKLQNANSLDLKVNTIKEIIKNDKKLTNTIVLNDASEWFIGSWSSIWMEGWQAGDRIIVSEQEFIFGNADHLLLNLDQGEKNLPEGVRAQLLHSRDKIKFEDLNKRKNRKWEINIDSIWYDNDSVVIELSNRTIWRCSRDKLNWLIGDDVIFLSGGNKKCKLQNLRNLKTINVSIINSDSPKIELPIIQEISANGERIVLSDESVWFSIGYESKGWQQGNRIIVSSLEGVNFDTSTHILINIDIKGSQNHRSATLVK